MSDKQKVLLDLFQFGLDLAGILDPTGVADGTSAVISMWRGEWLEAGISAASLLPYIGDLTKTAKLPKYVASVRKAIALGVKDAEFALQLRSVLTKLRSGMDQIPAGKLPSWAESQLRQLRSEIDEFLGRRFYKSNPKHETAGAAGRKGTKLDISADEAYQLLNDPAKCLEVAGKKQYVAVKDGKIYAYQPDNTGSFHAYPITGHEVHKDFPAVQADVAKLLGIDVKRLSRLGE